MPAAARYRRWYLPAAAAGLAALLAALLAGCSGAASSATAGSAAAGSAAAGSAAATPSVTGASPGASPSAMAAGLENAAPAAIVTSTRQAFVAARSVRVAGTMVEGSQTVEVDVTIKRGAGATGSLAVNGKPFKLLRIGTTAYIRGSAAFYHGIVPARTAALLTGKWLKVDSATKDYAGLLQLTDLGSFAKGILSPVGTLTTHGVVTVAGRRAVELRDDDGTALAVSLAGAPYPLRITPPTGHSERGLTFTAYNAPVTLTPPPASQVVTAPGTS